MKYQVHYVAEAEAGIGSVIVDADNIEEANERATTLILQQNPDFIAVDIVKTEEVLEIAN